MIEKFKMSKSLTNASLYLHHYHFPPFYFILSNLPNWSNFFSFFPEKVYISHFPQMLHIHMHDWHRVYKKTKDLLIKSFNTENLILGHNNNSYIYFPKKKIIDTFLASSLYIFPRQSFVILIQNNPSFF